MHIYLFIVDKRVYIMIIPILYYITLTNMHFLDINKNNNYNIIAQGD